MPTGFRKALFRPGPLSGATLEYAHAWEVSAPPRPIRLAAALRVLLDGDRVEMQIVSLTGGRRAELPHVQALAELLRVTLCYSANRHWRADYEPQRVSGASGHRDLFLADVMPMSLDRTYRPNDSRSRGFGIGATHLYDMFLVGTTSPWTYADLILPDGRRVHYDRISAGTSWSDAVYENTDSPTVFFKSTIYYNGNGGWNLDLKDGSRITFRDGYGATVPTQAAATRIADRHGNALVLTRNAAYDLTRVTSANGRWIEFAYDASHRVTQARDNVG